MGTEAGGSVGRAVGRAEGAAGWGTHPSSSLDAIEGEHSLHVLRQGLGLQPLEAINHWHNVLAAVQSSHNLLEKREGRRKRSGFPIQDPGAR